MAYVSLPSALRRYTDEHSRIEVPGPTVGAVLDNLVARAPAMATHLFAAGQLRGFIAVCHNGRDVRTLQGLKTPVQESDELRVLSSIAGG